MQNLFVLFLVMYEFSVYASNDLIMPGMLMVVQEFNAPLSFVSLSFTGYMFGQVLLQLFLGPLSDYFGKRRTILVGVATFLVFTVFLSLSHNIYMFLLGRVLQGSGLAFIAIGYSIIHGRFNDQNGVRIISLMGMISVLAPLMGPLIGTIIISSYGWRDIFIFTGFVASIAFIGLYKFLPLEETKGTPIKISRIGKTYWQALKQPKFIIGAICCGFSLLPILAWIALTPTVVMKTLHLPMIHYAIIQLFAMSGLVISALLMQVLAGRVSFFYLMTLSSLFAFIGMLLGFIFHNNFNIVVMGIAFYSFGLSIFYNLTFRLVMTIKGFPTGVLTSLLIFLQTTIIICGVEIINYICNIFNYSSYCLTTVNLSLAVLVLILIRVYAQINKNKQWE